MFKLVHSLTISHIIYRKLLPDDLSDPDNIYGDGSAHVGAVGVHTGDIVTDRDNITGLNNDSKDDDDDVKNDGNNNIDDDVKNDGNNNIDDNSESDVNKKDHRGKFFQQSLQSSLNKYPVISRGGYSLLSRRQYPSISNMKPRIRYRKSYYHLNPKMAVLKEIPTPEYRYRKLDFPPDHLGDSYLNRKMRALKDAENNMIKKLAKEKGSRKYYYNTYFSRNADNYYGKLNKTVSLKASFLDKLKHSVMQGVVQNSTKPCEGCSIIIPTTMNTTTTTITTTTFSTSINDHHAKIRKFIGNKEVKVVQSRMYCL